MTTSCGSNKNCSDELGCLNICPDFTIKRQDTRPAFEFIVKDCNGPLDLTNAVLEVSMWASAKFKKAVAETDTYFALADNIGFNQALVGDIIVARSVYRNPEQMLVTGFDESNKYIRVQRGYAGTTPLAYVKGSKIKIFRFINSIGVTESTLADVLQVDGSTTEDVLTKSSLIYEWDAQDTCLPGCYYLELKLLKMIDTESVNFMNLVDTVTPSFVTYSDVNLGCSLGEGVEWVRRFPMDKEGFIVYIVDTPNLETL